MRTPNERASSGNPSPEKMQAVRDRLLLLPRQRDQLLPALQATQSVLGYLPNVAIEAICTHLRLPLSAVDGVVAGYPDLERHEAAAHRVRVCTGPACSCAGGERLLESLVAGVGDDARVRIESVSCLFVCALAPAIEINRSIHGRMSARDAVDLCAGLLAPEVKP